MGDAAVEPPRAAVFPRNVAPWEIVPTSLSASGKQANAGGSVAADTTADDAAGRSKPGGMEAVVVQEHPMEVPLKGGGVDDDALPPPASSIMPPPVPRSASSVTQPDAHGDTAAGVGAEMFGPVEADTPERPGRQRVPVHALPSRPPIQTVGSNAESVVGSWEGPVDQAHRSSPTATSRPAPSSTLGPVAGLGVAIKAGGDVQEGKGPAGALHRPPKSPEPGCSPKESVDAAVAPIPRPAQRPAGERSPSSEENAKIQLAGLGAGACVGVASPYLHLCPAPPASPRSVNVDEDSARSGEEQDEDEPDEVSSSASLVDLVGDDAAAGIHTSTNNAVSAAGWPQSSGPGRTVTQPEPLRSPGLVGHAEEEATALAAASAIVDATAAPSPSSIIPAADIGPAHSTALPEYAGPWRWQDEEGEEEEEAAVSGNNPLYRHGPKLEAASPVGGPGPFPGESSGGAAASEASTPTPKAAATIFARFRGTTRGGSGGLFSRRATVAPGSEDQLPPAPDAGPVEPAPPRSSESAVAGGTAMTPGSDVLPAPMPMPVPVPMRPDFDKGGGGAEGRAGSGKTFPSGGDGNPGKTPLMSPLRSRTASPMGDVEEGGARATVVSVNEGVAAAVEAAAAAAVATEPGQIVLPCAPSDDEKVLYDRTGRLGLVACAIVAVIALSSGMWLFTLVSPAFYWFGAPSAFIVFYLGAHYLGVAMWGKDFRLKEHAEIVRRSEEKGYRPAVDVFLPVCKEPLHLLANTWRHVKALDYADVKVFVLDDGKNDEVKVLAASFGFEYVLRADAPALKKAGNLRNAFGRTSGEAIAIFDADFCPRPDFLKETVPYLGEDPSIGILQTPQFFRHRKEQTWIERGAGVSQEFFYRMVQVNQDRFNAAVCVGSCGLYRRAALEPLGGMAAIEHSEDMYTGYKMTENGFKIKYVPLALAMGICPDEPQSFFMQQYRWCKGSCTLVTETGFWRSKISKIHKLCFLNGLMYYIATALMVFLAPIPILLLVWTAADGLLWYHSGFVLPSIIFASIIMPLWSKQPYGMACHRVKIIQCYAHMFAIKDTFMGRSAPWVPSGHGRSR
eukprot:g10398.t1